MSEGEAALDESGEQPDAMETLAEICKHAEVAISFVASLTTNTTSEMEDAVGGEGVMLPLVLMAVSLVFAVRGGRLIRPACVVAAAAIGFWVVWDMLHMFVGMAQVSEPSRSRSRSRSCSPNPQPQPLACSFARWALQRPGVAATCRTLLRATPHVARSWGTRKAWLACDDPALGEARSSAPPAPHQLLITTCTCTACTSSAPLPGAPRGL